MKKILFIPHTLSTGGGSEKVLSDLISELNDLGYAITVIERLECSTNQFKLPIGVKKLKSISFSNKYIIKEKLKPKLLYKNQRRLNSILTYFFPKRIYKNYIKEDFDFEISFNYLYPSFLVVNSPNKKSKKIVWVHGSLDDLDFVKYNGFKRILYYFYYKMQLKSFDKADKIICTSNNTLRSINDFFHDYLDKVVIIYNGYDFDNIRLLAEKSNIMKSVRQYRLISAGRLDENKNTILQIEAIKILIEKGLDIELLILGEGNQKNKLIKRSIELGLTDNIKFIGFVQNQYSYINSSDVLLLSSLQEGFPTIVVEALSLGIPVITTHVGGIDELIKPNINGLVAGFSPIEYSKCIEEMLRIQTDKVTIKESVNHLTKEKWGQNVSDLLNKL